MATFVITLKSNDILYESAVKVTSVTMENLAFQQYYISIEAIKNKVVKQFIIQISILLTMYKIKQKNKQILYA
jgi:hypothetical protein